jgi:LmbE family N-acetylglucosaminyl deacetylase
LVTAGEAAPGLYAERVPSAPLTLMCVHAHPDDEAISTGGILARYAGEGVQTVLVTCTNGELGDGPGGVKPGEPGHTPQAVVAARRAELETSCAVLSITHLEMLGYHDSGMMGWPQNDAPDAFWHVDVTAAASRLGALMERYRPQVVVTYDANGFYGHPDHIQAHRVTVAALANTNVVDKLYYPAIPASALPRLAELLAEHGLEVPEELDDAPFGTPDEQISAVIDVSTVTEHKYDSLAAHASQSDNIFFLSMGREVFGAVFREEAFVRAQDRTEAPVPETDLFAGIR